jgi:parallel beta-helix repeat protein
MKKLMNWCWKGLVALALSRGVIPAATFIVTNTNDAGTGSFRQALFNANGNSGVNLIQFNLPGSGVRTLAPLTPLPLITSSLTIDGYSQPGSGPNTLTNGNNGVLLVRLDGVNLTNGFPIGLSFTNANNNTVRGLVIVRFHTGIQLYASSGNTIAGNWIGLDVDGISRGNSGTGVEVTCAVFNRSTGNLIGGTSPADRNVISGNRAGITFSPTPADHNTVQGNFIGTDATGALPRGNLFEGIKVQTATNILIGGSSPGAGNLIGANGTGVSLVSSSHDVIQGNFIGTDVTGHYDLGNLGDGIDLQGCSFTTVGGANAGNLIGNNPGYGIFLLGCVTNVVQGNWIDTDLGGAWPLGNGKDGIFLQASSATTIGGGSPGAANIIEFNSGAGVNIYSGQSNRVSANSIFDNGGQGILLGAGANGSQSAPLLTNAIAAYDSIHVQGFLSSQPNTSFRVEFFASQNWDAAGLAEAQVYLGAASLTTGADGIGTFSVSLPVAASESDLITATATDPSGNTSALSTACSMTVGPAGVSLSVGHSNNTHILFWPSAAAGYQLEAAASLKSPGTWHLVTNGINDDGILKSCVIPVGAAPTNQFFRLKR